MFWQSLFVCLPNNLISLAEVRVFDIHLVTFLIVLTSGGGHEYFHGRELVHYRLTASFLDDILIF